MFQVDRNGAKRLHASQAGRGPKISHDDDAQNELLILLLLLLSRDVGVRLSES
jgi:hypothetical protein